MRVGINAETQVRSWLSRGNPKQDSTQTEGRLATWDYSLNPHILNMATATSVLAETTYPGSFIPDIKVTSPSAKNGNASLLDIPTELKLHIIQNRDALDQVHLKMTCRTFNELIPRPAMKQLLKLEISTFAMREGKDLHACTDCLRLLPRTDFADQMVKGKRGKFGTHREKRFCIQCGINPRPGITRYSRGACIDQQGERFVICWHRGKYERGDVEEENNIASCKGCQSILRDWKRCEEEKKARAA